MAREDRPLRPYIGRDVMDDEGVAVLVFARDNDEARLWAWRAFCGVWDSEYIDMRARLLSNPEWYMPYAPADGRPVGRAEIPPDLVCSHCERWGDKDPARRYCADCQDLANDWKREVGH